MLCEKDIITFIKSNPNCIDEGFKIKKIHAFLDENGYLCKRINAKCNADILGTDHCGNNVIVEIKTHTFDRRDFNQLAIYLSIKNIQRIILLTYKKFLSPFLSEFCNNKIEIKSIDDINPSCSNNFVLIDKLQEIEEKVNSLWEEMQKHRNQLTNHKTQLGIIRRLLCSMSKNRKEKFLWENDKDGNSKEKFDPNSYVEIILKEPEKFVKEYRGLKYVSIENIMNNFLGIGRPRAMQIKALAEEKLGLRKDAQGNTGPG